jgi:hypothetical protein
MSEVLKTALFFSYLPIGVFVAWFCLPVGYFFNWPPGFPRAAAYGCEVLFWPLRLIHTILVKLQTPKVTGPISLATLQEYLTEEAGRHFDARLVPEHDSHLFRIMICLRGKVVGEGQRFFIDLKQDRFSVLKQILTEFGKVEIK